MAITKLAKSLPYGVSILNSRVYWPDSYEMMAKHILLFRGRLLEDYGIHSVWNRNLRLVRKPKWFPL